ncbi:IPT/TIG domain-containing protein [Gemmatirosa kalamazoonensis]|uniref:IPT/TIG domain-containing protein n=1 Tax=Gemmatirosa kalamazoonensis TaxID=861299 RepID=UPI00046CC2C8|nr:IPT/TIG domain-containing protein [Gemmatirosa kalamazoonensis]
MLGLALACGGTDPTAPLPLYTVLPIGGVQLAAPAGSELRQPIQVEVREPDGAPAKGVAVRFRIVSGRGAVLTDTLVATNADGVGLTRLRLGGTRDSVVIAGSVRGQEDRGVEFRVLPTAPAELIAVQPATYASGDTIVLRGARLADGGSDVLFGSARGRVVGAPSDTLVQAVVPPCLPSGAVSVAVRTGSATTNSVPTVSLSADAPLRLATGEGITSRGTEAGCLRLQTPGQRYLLVPQYASYADSVPAERQYALAIDGATTATMVDDSARRASVQPAAGRLDVRGAFEQMLRATERDIARDVARDAAPAEPTDLEGARAEVRSPNTAALTDLPPPPSLGSTRTFRVLSRLDGTAFTSTTARLRYAGTNILLYEDVGAPAPLADTTVTQLGDLFDRTLYEIDATTFGTESDIDGNGRVIVLMTPLVNALTSAAQCTSQGYVPGYFFGVDLDTRNKNSNRGEIYYSFVPDPGGERSCPHRLGDVMALLPATFLHEFQHMISFNQHVLVRRGSVEAVWLNEGLSHVAEELGARYYDVRYPAPSGRTQTSALLPDSAVPFLRGNLENATLYLSSPTSHSVTAFRDFGTLEERGAAWLFLKWLGAQKGDGVYARLVQTGLRSGQNVESAAGEPFASLFGDFALALYADSVPGLPRAAVSPRYRTGTRPLRELLARGFGLSGYPLALRGQPLTGSLAFVNMVQGTATYFLLTVPAGGVTVRLTGPNGGALSPTLSPQLGVLRISP